MTEKAPRTLKPSSQAMLELCSRPEGATGEELLKGTKWRTAPSWTFVTNRLARQVGRDASTQEVDGKRRYYIS